MTEPNEARRYTVRGRVQGVGFRWFVEAEGAQTSGFPDGSVTPPMAPSNCWLWALEQLVALQAKLWQGPACGASGQC